MGAIFKVPAMIIYTLGGLWGFFICLGIVDDALGLIGTVIAFFLFPVTIYLAPWYAGFFKGNWFPILVVYGSSILAFALYFIGSLFDEK